MPRRWSSSWSTPSGNWRSPRTLKLFYITPNASISSSNSRNRLSGWRLSWHLSLIGLSSRNQYHLQILHCHIIGTFWTNWWARDSVRCTLCKALASGCTIRSLMLTWRPSLPSRTTHPRLMKLRVIWVLTILPQLECVRGIENAFQRTDPSYNHPYFRIRALWVPQSPHLCLVPLLS